MDQADRILLATAVVLAATVVVFFASLSWVWKYRWRVDGESLCAIDRSDDALSESERAFLDSCHAESAKSGGNHVLDFMVVESGLRKIIHLTRIPQTPLVVYRYRYIPTQRRLFGLRDSIEVVNRTDNAAYRSVTNDQLPLKDHTGQFADTIVLPRTSRLNALCAVAWAIAVSTGSKLHAFAPSVSSEEVLQHLIDYRSQVNIEMCKSGKVVELPSGEFRFSRRTCVHIAACTCPPVPYLTSLVRRTRRDKFVRALRPLLPADLDADWIIPAVQDRVRTGSTAPLTQP